jgi:hypothetical protein
MAVEQLGRPDKQYKHNAQTRHDRRQEATPPFPSLLRRGYHFVVTGGSPNAISDATATIIPQFNSRRQNGPLIFEGVSSGPVGHGGLERTPQTQ